MAGLTLTQKQKSGSGLPFAILRNDLSHFSELQMTGQTLKVIMRDNQLFITCSLGLEPVLEKELNSLGFEHVTAGYCGVHVNDSSMQAIYKINYCSRVASRVLLPIRHFRCQNRHALYREVSAIDWLKYVKPNQTFAIDANVHHRLLRNSLYAAQVVKDAICDQLHNRTGNRPSVNVKDPDVQLNLFIDRETAVIYFDTSGQPLNKRGYRQETSEAPLRESLAAAMLYLANYQGGDEIVYDPCCGSGTLLIEAALMATKTPPGYLRLKWGFMSLPNFSQREWLSVKMEADQQRIPLQKNVISGSDINKNAIRICKANLRAAGFHQTVDVLTCDFRTLQLAVQPNFLITNPPHGNRIGEVDQLKPLYRSLGELMKTCLTKPSKGFVFTGSLELAKEVGLAPKQRFVLSNSNVDSRFLAYDIY